MSDDTIEKLAKSVKNNYHNEWQKQNRDKVRKSQNRYWQKKAKEILEKQKNNNKDNERSNNETSYNSKIER